MDRVKVLREIEVFQSKRKSNEDRDLRNDIMKAVKSQSIQHALEDQVSHFVLRLAYCTREDLRTWFLKQECTLFRTRFLEAHEKEIDVFFKSCGLSFKEAKNMEQEVRAGIHKVLDGLYGSRKEQLDLSTIYQIPFEEALDMLKNRRCFIRAGFAYVIRSDLVSIVMAKFRMHLSKQLARLQPTVSLLRQDKKLGPLLDSLSKQYMGTNTFNVSTKISGDVNESQVAGLAETHFPLCMHNLHYRLQQESHLKHGGRMQFGLFLKAVGLSVEQALLFWKRMFSKKTPADKFDKQYSYTIRHNYGKEGKRVQYTPYGCNKIINMQPGAGDHCGCPFKHFDEAALRARLSMRRVPASGTNEIIELVHGMHYQVACQKYFALMHEGKEPELGINHPNSYYEQSVAFALAKESGNGVKNEGGGGSSSSSSSSSSSGSGGGGGGGRSSYGNNGNGGGGNNGGGGGGSVKSEDGENVKSESSSTSGGGTKRPRNDEDF
jgi:DNA primase large subunit